MKRLLVFWVGLLALLAPVNALAGVQYTIHWHMWEGPTSCETTTLSKPTYFDVNETPLPTSEIPGTFTRHADDSTTNEAEAPFDSSLLRWGTNHFFFHVRTTGDPDCVDAQEIVHLVAPTLGLNKPLFDIPRNPLVGEAVEADKTLDLSLEEINPDLARDIVNLEEEIAAERAWLFSHASQAADLAARLDVLKQLETELLDLAKRPLDEISGIDLDAIFDRYAGALDDATRAALKQVIEDLKKSVVDLENELASLIDQFGAQADAVVNLATAGAQAEGFDPDDPNGYGLGATETPWVEVPDVSGVKGAFNEGNDPYDAYADAVLATLESFVQGGEVVARGSFAANVKAWRANMEALERALLERVSVSQAETNAFLKAQIKVMNYVLQFMNTSYWYLDAPVPPDVRAAVDGVLKNRFGPMAEDMKDNLNQWDDDTLDLGATELVETIRAFAGVVSAVGDVLVPYAEVMQTLVHGTTRIAIGFVPVVGPTLDLCEAVTGKMFCLPFAKEFSTEERIMSAVGFGVAPLSKAWSAVKNSGVKPGAKAVAQGVLTLGEEFAQALQVSRRTTYKTLRGAVGAVTDDFEKKAGLYLMKEQGRALIGVGDDGVRKVLGIPKDSAPNTILGRAPDYLSVTKGNKLALSEVKGGGSIDMEDTLKQLQNAMDKLKEKNLSGEVERIEIIIKKFEGGFNNANLGTKDGYLYDMVNHVTIHIKGFPLLFVKIIEI